MYFLIKQILNGKKDKKYCNADNFKEYQKILIRNMLIIRYIYINREYFIKLIPVRKKENYLILVFYFSVNDIYFPKD